MPQILTYRRLDPVHDRRAVARFYPAAADYILLETGRAPDAGTVSAFFSGAPPGVDAALALREGLFLDGVLAGIAELAPDWPGPGDACITLMLLGIAARGQGRGSAWAARLEAAAQSRGAVRMAVHVLPANARGRGFWLRQGYLPQPGPAGKGRPLLTKPLPEKPRLAKPSLAKPPG